MDDPLQSLPSPEVCIVGAGPAGLAAALRLGEASRTVLLLESGSEAPSPRAQELNEGESEGAPYDGLRATRHRAVGGTPHIWDVELEGRPGAKYVPLGARDLDDWPLGPDDLEPFYREAQRLCGLGAFAYSADAWATEARRPFDLSGTGLTSGVYHFGDARRFTRELPDRIRGMDTVRLVPSTTVVGLVVDGGIPSVRGVRAVDATGASFEVEAGKVVLACGAVENARLLLLAGLGEGGSPGWLGRGFMEHARDFSPVLVPSSSRIFAEASFYDAREARDGSWVGGRLAPTRDALEAHDVPNFSMTLIPRARRRRSLPERVLRAAHAAVSGGRSGRYGWSRVPAPARAFDVFETVLNLEQRSDARNRIELGDRTDRHGNPLPRLVLGWSDREQERLDRLRRLLRGWIGDAGLGRLETTPGRPPDLNAHHHAGTTRMGASPREGVVDAHGRVFGVDDLFVAGASVFPSAGFANPTLTVVAMALRLAERLDAALP